MWNTKFFLCFSFLRQRDSDVGIFLLKFFFIFIMKHFFLRSQSSWAIFLGFFFSVSLLCIFFLLSTFLHFCATFYRKLSIFCVFLMLIRRLRTPQTRLWRARWAKSWLGTGLFPCPGRRPWCPLSSEGKLLLRRSPTRTMP